MLSEQSSLGGGGAPLKKEWLDKQGGADNLELIILLVVKVVEQVLSLKWFSTLSVKAKFTAINISPKKSCVWNFVSQSINNSLQWFGDNHKLMNVFCCQNDQTKMVNYFSIYLFVCRIVSSFNFWKRKQTSGTSMCRCSAFVGSARAVSIKVKDICWYAHCHWWSIS